VRYLLDANIFITAKDSYYNPGFCSAFWGWIDAAHQGGRVFSIDKVKKELLAGDADDHLVTWASERNDDFFLPSKGTLYKWDDLVDWVENRTPSFTAAAKEKFLQENTADPWLIAFAAHHGGYTIVTNEVSSPERKNSIKLPDAADGLGIQTIKLFELLDLWAHNNFSFLGQP